MKPAAILALPFLLLAGCVTELPVRDPVEKGRAIAQQRCSACHAVDMVGASPRAGAPPLRDLFKRYPIEGLHRAFINGVHVGHPDMPTFRLQRPEADALLAYLRSIDPCQQASSNRVEMERCFAPL